MSSDSTTTHSKPDLSDHEEEAIPFDDVMRRLLEAKPRHQKAVLSAPENPGTPPKASTP